MKKRDVKRLILLFVIVILFFLLLSVSIGLVNSTKRVRTKKSTIVEETDVRNDDLSDEREQETRDKVELVEEGNTVDRFQKVKNVYSLNEDVDSAAKDFLGDNYEKYSGVINLIVSNSDAILNQIPEGRGFNPVDCTTLGKAFTESLGLSNGMEGISSFFIESSLTVIYYFDSTKVIYAYDYSNNPENELVVIDYANIEKDVTDLSVMEIGDERSASGNVNYCKIQKFGDFNVLFLKG